MKIRELFTLRSALMSAKQLLNYAVNKANEGQAVLILQRSGVKFRVNTQVVGYDEKGQLVNDDGQVVSFGAGQVTAVEWPGEIEPAPTPDGGKTPVGGEPPAAPAQTQGVVTTEQNVGVQGSPKNEVTQIGSGTTTTTEGQGAVVKTAPAGDQVSPEAAQKHAAVGGGTPNTPPEPVKAEPPKVDPAVKAAVTEQAKAAPAAAPAAPSKPAGTDGGAAKP